jgi:hypothetical protein
MPNFKPEDRPGWYQEDLTPVPRHEFTEANQLHLFPFDEDDTPRLDCPDDCGAFCEPANLGEAVDWALGHKCEDQDAAPAAAGEE